MTVVTIITGPRHGVEATDKYPGMNPCRFHGLAPVVQEQEKRKGSRWIKTGDATAECPECKKEDPERGVFACLSDIVWKWNKFNPVFESEDARRDANIAEIKKELDSYLNEQIKAQKEVDRLEIIIERKEQAIRDLRHG